TPTRTRGTDGEGDGRTPGAFQFRRPTRRCAAGPGRYRPARQLARRPQPQRQCAGHPRRSLPGRCAMSSSARRRAAFDVYVGLGPGRSITAVFLELSTNRQKYHFRRVPSVRTLETWSTEDGWVARLTEFEIEASRSDSVRHLEVVQGHRDRVV